MRKLNKVRIIHERKRKISSIIVLFIVLTTIISVLVGCSEPDISVPTPQADVYIYDQDDIIDDSIEAELNKALVELEEKTEVEFVVISIKKLGYYDIETYSNKVFNELGIGKQDKDNGVLLLFSRFDNRVRLEIGRGLEGILNDAKCGRILDNYFVPYREEDKYTEATEMTVKTILGILSEEYNVTIHGVERGTPEELSEETLFSDIFALILIIVLIIILYIISDLGNGYGGGYYGGGFFGRGSSGGGFGGGFSGGGGASR